MLLRYITPVFALLVAVIAVVGPMRSPEEGGQDIITPWGWGTIFLAILTCIAGIVETYRQTTETRRQRIRADNAERSVQRAALSELSPGVRRLHDVMTFGFLLPYLGSPEESPKKIPDDLKLPQRAAIDPRSDHWTQSLIKFNFIPRRSWAFPYRPSGSLDTFLNRSDPYETTVPYCLDGRQFHWIVSEEAKKAKAELRTALEKGAYIAFPSDVLDLATQLIEHPFLQSLVELAEWLERWIRIEDDYEDSETMHLSMIDDRRTSVEEYKNFMDILITVESKIHDSVQWTPDDI